MKAPPRACRRTLAAASSYLDGQLPAADRRPVQDHLRDCEDCLHQYRQLRQLAAAARALPVARPPRGLRQSVRRAVAARRAAQLAELGRARRSPLRDPWLIAAAFAVLITTAFGAVVLGYRAGLREARDTSVTELAPPPTVAPPSDIAAAPTPTRSPATTPAAVPAPHARPGPTPRAAPVAVGAPEPSPPSRPAPRLTLTPRTLQPTRDPGFARAAQGLAADVALLDTVKPALRQPLLASQLAHFDLPSRARLLLEEEPATQAADRALARFIGDLCRQVAGARLDDAVLRAHVLGSGLLPAEDHGFAAPAGGGLDLDRTRLRGLVERCAGSRPATERSALLRYLELKHRWVYGLAVDTAPAERPPALQPRTEDPLQAPTEALLATALVEAGQPEISRTLLDGMPPDARALIARVLGLALPAGDHELRSAGGVRAWGFDDGNGTRVRIWIGVGARRVEGR